MILISNVCNNLSSSSSKSSLLSTVFLLRSLQLVLVLFVDTSSAWLCSTDHSGFTEDIPTELASQQTSSSVCRRFFALGICKIFKKYKTFSVLIYSYINTSGNWKNEKLCGNTTPAGRSVFTQFRVFPIFTSVDITVYQYGKNVVYFFYNIAQRTLTEKWREIFRVDIELYQYGS